MQKNVKSHQKRFFFVFKNSYKRTVSQTISKPQYLQCIMKCIFYLTSQNRIFLSKCPLMIVVLKIIVGFKN